MQTQANSKDIILNLVNKMNDIQLLETAHFMQFIRQKSNSDTFDLLKASESTLDFWDNEEDTVWDNV